MLGAASAAAGFASPAYRVYFTQRGNVLIILLSGGSKATQQADIRRARARGETTMTKITTTPCDVSEHLRTPEEMALYLDACIAESDGDAAFIAKALGDIARAKGMSEVARDAGLSRESLYKALSGQRNPDFSTILAVTRAPGVQLRAAPAHKPS